MPSFSPNLFAIRASKISCVSDDPISAQMKLSEISGVSVPASSTPVVRLFRGAVANVGKRRANRDSHHRSRAFSITSEPPRQSLPANSYRIALLSEVSVDDAIVVSALTIAPFCCHADLLTMSAPQLTAVARVLNESLPPPLHIKAEPGCPPGQIRVEIEAVVGLRPPSHSAPSSSVQLLSQSQSEYPAPYHCLVNGDRVLKDMNYAGNIGMTPPVSPKCRLTSGAGIIRESTSRASSSLGVQWSCTALSASNTDVGTPPSRHCRRKDQVRSLLTSTPIDEALDAS